MRKTERTNGRFGPPAHRAPGPGAQNVTRVEVPPVRGYRPGRPLGRPRPLIGRLRARRGRGLNPLPTFARSTHTHRTSFCVCCGGTKTARRPWTSRAKPPQPAETLRAAAETCFPPPWGDCHFTAGHVFWAGKPLSPYLCRARDRRAWEVD